MDTDMGLKIENVIWGLRNYGYRIFVQPIDGRELEFYEALRKGLEKADRNVAHIQKVRRCRGINKNVIAALHQSLPEPCWGVSAP